VVQLRSDRCGGHMDCGVLFLVAGVISKQNYMLGDLHEAWAGLLLLIEHCLLTFLSSSLVPWDSR
jgi:hypothetical protein